MFQIDCPSCLNVKMDFHFALLIWAVLAYNMDLVFYKIGLSSVYHPYLVTTHLIASNKLRRKEITHIHFWQDRSVHWNAFHVTTSWSWLREWQECAKLFWRILNIKYILICFYTFLVGMWFHMSYYIVLMSSLLFYNVENSQKKEKPLNE